MRRRKGTKGRGVTGDKEGTGELKKIIVMRQTGQNEEPKQGLQKVEEKVLLFVCVCVCVCGVGGWGGGCSNG